MLVVLITTKTEYGKMSTFERNAMEGDLFSGHNPYASMDKDKVSDKGKVKDLIIPIAVLIVCCVAGMIFTGNFFDPSSSNYLNFIKAFADSDASTGLSSGSLIALIFSMIYFYFRKTVHFNDIMESIPEGFKAMVPAIMILTFAWTLKAMTDSLGATVFVRDFVRSQAAGMQLLLPAIVFLIGCLLAFATGTSWGTFGMLIPIVQSVFTMDNPMAVVCIAACMSGAVCGDHCSPISDTTIMASAGAECHHVDHVTTQLPYAITAAIVSFTGYILTGILVYFNASPVFALPLSIILMILVIFTIKARQHNK